MDESSPGNSNGSPVMPPENSTQEGTASEVRANANSQDLFAVTRTTETRNVLLVVVGILLLRVLQQSAICQLNFSKKIILTVKALDMSSS